MSNEKWIDLAQSLFPGSRNMTPEESAAFEAINRQHFKPLAKQPRRIPQRCECLTCRAQRGLLSVAQKLWPFRGRGAGERA